MGEVYRARDTRLGRDVAIKVLPAEFASDPERVRRFEKEARATGSLNHPNILAIYDVGTREGSPYLVEELLEGQTLREVLKAGPLPVRRAVELVVQMANGLAAAHGKGIVHRDLKPENLFVTDAGHVKILDFGLAKLVGAPLSPEKVAAASTFVESTEAGAVLGTVGYMAPEQVRGLAVDHRADIFALGCVLYEMLSGQRAFAGPTAMDTLTAILSREPPPLSRSALDIPPALQAIVSHCLEKRPEERYSSAHDLALALRAVSGGAETPAPTQVGVAPVPSRRHRAVVVALAGVAVVAVIGALVVKLRPAGSPAGAAGLKKIVVLPFENLGLAEDAYFAAGMAEEITSRLANVQGLGVISRTTAVQYNQTGKTVKQIGADLGVDYVLEGTVRFEHGSGKESRVRITPQLIRVADDTHVWADRYDRVLADVFAIQSDVAESAVQAMGVALLPRERTALKEVSTNDLEAYNLYLQGLELFGRGSNREFIEGALRKFEAAVDRDPRFAQALAMAAAQHLTMYWLHQDHSPERLAKGKEAAERAVELRPDLAETHGALAQYYYHGLLECPRALDELATALRVQPSNVMALFLKGLVLRAQGRSVEAAEVLSKAVELDPRNPQLLAHFGTTCVLVRRYAEADRALALAAALSPPWSWPHETRVQLQVRWHGDVDKAQALLEEASHIVGSREKLEETWLWLAMLRRDYQGILRYCEAEEQQVKEDDLEGRSGIWLLRGQVQMLVGQGDLARRSFESACVEFEQLTRRSPDEASFHGSLGIAYAALGRRADAIREATLGRDLPATRCNAAPRRESLWDLAVVYTMIGQPGEAMDVLDVLLAQSGWVTPHQLRLHPAWDPLRSDPRFQALLVKYEVKE